MRIWPATTFMGFEVMETESMAERAFAARSQNAVNESRCTIVVGVTTRILCFCFVD